MSKIVQMRYDSLGVGGANPGLEHKLIIQQAMRREETFFVGTGLNDLFIGSTFNGIENTTYNFVISSIVTGIDKYQWRKKTSGAYGAYSSDIDIDLNEQSIELGLIVKWGHELGHDLGDEWTVTFARINAFQILNPIGDEVFSVDGDIVTGVKQRSVSIDTSATPTPDSDTTDIYTITALAEGATFGAPTGSPVEGQRLIIRIKDDGAPRILAWNGAYREGSDIALPLITTLGKTMYCSFIYNDVDSVWDFVGTIGNFT